MQPQRGATTNKHKSEGTLCRQAILEPVSGFPHPEALSVDQKPSSHPEFGLNNEMGSGLSSNYPNAMAVHEYYGGQMTK